MSNPPWMPLNIADYLRDTTHLDAEQSGCYLHLIMAYWVAGGLPNDDRQLAKIARIPLRKWRYMRPVMEAFFRPGFSSHKRINQELQRVASIKEKARQAARQRWSKHASGNHAGAYANASLGHMPYTKKERLTDREIEEGAVDNSGQADQKRSAEEGKDAVAEMRARRMLARKGQP